MPDYAPLIRYPRYDECDLPHSTGRPFAQ